MQLVLKLNKDLHCYNSTTKWPAILAYLILAHGKQGHYSWYYCHSYRVMIKNGFFKIEQYLKSFFCHLSPRKILLLPMLYITGISTESQGSGVALIASAKTYRGKKKQSFVLRFASYREPGPSASEKWLVAGCVDSVEDLDFTQSVMFVYDVCNTPVWLYEHYQKLPSL